MLPLKTALTIVFVLTLMANAVDFFGTFGFIWVILRNKLTIDRYFNSVSGIFTWNNLKIFLYEQGIVTLTAASIFVSFSLGKREGRRIFAVAQTLFPRSKTPRALGGVTMAIVIPLIIFVYLVNLFLMAYFIDNITILTALVSVIFAVSILSNWMQRANLLKHLEDPQFNPSPQSDDYDFIMKSRGVVKTYYFDHWHQTRETVALFICVSTLFLSWWEANIPFWLPYVVVSLTILVNEFIQFRWRNSRDIALLAIDG